MSTHIANISWSRDGTDFAPGRYSALHTWRFDGGAEVRGSPTPQVAPPPMSDPTAVDPEEAFVAALSSCHMLFFLAIAARRGFPMEEPVPLRELPRHTFNALPALMMPAILLYGIYGGVTTPTEAAAVAAFYALLLAAFFYRALSLRSLFDILVESARSSAAVGLVIGGALILNYVVASENIPSLLANRMLGLDQFFKSHQQIVFQAFRIIDYRQNFRLRAVGDHERRAQ